MYESPIKQMTTEMQFMYENECMKVVQGCGFDVDKEELAKALAYDRGQYEKGYEDGYNEAIDKLVNAIKESEYLYKWMCSDSATEFCCGDYCGDCRVIFEREIDEVAEKMKGGNV